MFDIGWSELLLIGVAAIIVIGPKDLPRAMRQAGRWMATVRRLAGDFQSQVNEAMRETELDELRREAQSLKREAQAALEPARTVEQEVRTAIEAQPKPAKPAKAAPPPADATAPARPATPKTTAAKRPAARRTKKPAGDKS